MFTSSIIINTLSKKNNKMRRFVTLTLALVLGYAAAQLRLGDYCESNELCNSGCCWYGVCRDSFDNCSEEFQDEAYERYEGLAALPKSGFEKLKTFIGLDIKKRLGKSGSGTAQGASVDGASDGGADAQ
jgi:hypothetical protein